MFGLQSVSGQVNKNFELRDTEKKKDQKEKNDLFWGTLRPQ